MNNIRGFTLIELLVVIALIAVAASLMYTFFAQGLALYTAESESFSNQETIRQVLSDITNKARLSEPSAISCSGNVLTVDGTVYKLSGSQILKNGHAIAKNISGFTVSVSRSILNVSIADTAGTQLETSLSLAPQVR